MTESDIFDDKIVVEFQGSKYSFTFKGTHTLRRIKELLKVNTNNIIMHGSKKEYINELDTLIPKGQYILTILPKISKLKPNKSNAQNIMDHPKPLSRLEKIQAQIELIIDYFNQNMRSRIDDRMKENINECISQLQFIPLSLIRRYSKLQDAITDTVNHIDKIKASKQKHESELKKCPKVKTRSKELFKQNEITRSKELFKQNEIQAYLKVNMDQMNKLYLLLNTILIISKNYVPSTDLFHVTDFCSPELMKRAEHTLKRLAQWRLIIEGIQYKRFKKETTFSFLTAPTNLFTRSQKTKLFKVAEDRNIELGKPIKTPVPLEYKHDKEFIQQVESIYVKLKTKPVDLKLLERIIDMRIDSDPTLESRASNLKFAALDVLTVLEDK